MNHPANRVEPLPEMDARGWRKRRTLNPRRYHYTALAGLEFLIGAWSFLAPWMLGLFHHRSAWVGGFILGAILVLGAVITMAAASGTSTVVHPSWLTRWSVVTIVLGCWSIAAPWVLGFSSRGAGLWNGVVCGIGLILLGLAMTRASTAMVAEGAGGGVPDPEAHVLDTVRP